MTAGVDMVLMMTILYATVGAIGATLALIAHLARWKPPLRLPPPEQVAKTMPYRDAVRVLECPTCGHRRFLGPGEVPPAAMLPKPGRNSTRSLGPLVVAALMSVAAPAWAKKPAPSPSPAVQRKQDRYFVIHDGDQPLAYVEQTGAVHFVGTATARDVIDYLLLQMVALETGCGTVTMTGGGQ